MHNTQVCMFCRYRRTVFEDGVRVPCRHAARATQGARENGSPTEMEAELVLRQPAARMDAQRHFR